MLTILLHSSKTMRSVEMTDSTHQAPQLIAQSSDLAEYVKSLDTKQLQKHMQLSETKAVTTQELAQAWTAKPNLQRPAIDAFLGDIYSGLQIQTFNDKDRDYANDHLLILSGLYGGLRALDSIHPYRLEMGYRLPERRFANLYDFWGDSIAKLIPKDNLVINLSAVEYTKAVLPYVHNNVITPKFMTISEKTGEPTFVTVHAKIARGAFARWLIKNQINDENMLSAFDDLGYIYDTKISTKDVPVFVCKKFKGLGLSVRLT